MKSEKTTKKPNELLLPNDARCQLSSARRKWIVDQYAQGVGAAGITTLYAEEFGETLTYATAKNYNPCHRNSKLSRKLRKYYEERREFHAEAISQQWASSPAIRLRRLWDIAEREGFRGDPRVAIRALEACRIESEALFEKGLLKLPRPQAPKQPAKESKPEPPTQKSYREEIAEILGIPVENLPEPGSTRGFSSTAGSDKADT